MLAARLERPAAAAAGPLVLRGLADPLPGPGELLIRVTACGVCRTDLQLAEGELPPRLLPITPGHQAVGVVESLGEGATGWATGDRAGVAWLASTCGACAHCRAGRENLCVAATFTGWDRDGGFSTHLVARADFAHRLPAAFPDLAAAPLLCGGVIGYRSLRVCGIQPGQRLGLYGFGASALCAIQVATYWGCEVFVCTRSEREQQRARDLGAAWAGGYDDTPPVPLDAAVTFAPAGDVVVAALKALDRGGTVAVNAIHLDRVPEFSYDYLWWERSIRSVANFTRQDAREFLDLASVIPVRTSVEAHALRDANVALGRLASGQVSGAAVLVME
jgi:propanol-preferring alcohol dehydrogenase